MNGDSGANYDQNFFQSNGTFPSAAQTAGAIGNFPGSTATPNLAGSLVAHFPVYRGTTFYKTVFSSENSYATLGTTGNYFTGVITTVWRSVSAITSIVLSDAGGGNFITGSSFYLYGIT